VDLIKKPSEVNPNGIAASSPGFLNPGEKSFPLIPTL